jgi:hypothetical protein
MNDIQTIFTRIIQQSTKYKSLLTSLALILGLFLVSVVIRLDQLQNQPQGQGFYNSDYSVWTNTDVNYHVLSTLKIYDDYPSGQHYFVSYIPTYGRYDSLANSYATNRIHKELVVYPSFSPAVFIAPYLAFKVLDLKFSYTNLQLFSLAVHLLTIILVFFVVRAFVNKKYSRNLIAILAASIYIFSTSTLNDHMNVWWAHQMMQPIYLLILLRLIQTKGRMRPWELFLHSLILILVNWTGLFVMMGIASYYAVRLFKKRDKSNLYPVVAICTGGILAITLIVAHVLFAADIDLITYLDKIITRVDSRSASVDYVPLASLILNNINNIIIDFGAYLIGALLLLFTLYKKRYFSKSDDSFRWVVIGITLVPILESTLLIEHDTVYGFGRLKFLIPLILTAALLVSILIQNTQSKRRITMASMVTMFTIGAIIHTFLYLDIYGNGFNNQDNYRHYLPAPAEPKIPR